MCFFVVLDKEFLLDFVETAFGSIFCPLFWPLELKNGRVFSSSVTHVFSLQTNSIDVRAVVCSLSLSVFPPTFKTSIYLPSTFIVPMFVRYFSIDSVIFPNIDSMCVSMYQILSLFQFFTGIGIRAFFFSLSYTCSDFYEFFNKLNTFLRLAAIFSALCCLI